MQQTNDTENLINLADHRRRNQKSQCSIDHVPEHSQSNQNSKSSIQRIDQFFLEMAGIYPYSWAGQFDDMNSIKIAKVQWMKGLQGLTNKQLEKGLDYFRTNGEKFPPSVPEFRKKCLQDFADFGILKKEEAFQIFLQKDFSNPILRMVRDRIDYFNFKRASTNEAKKIFMNLYDICLDKYLSQSKEGRALLSKNSESNSQQYFLENSYGDSESD